MPWKECSVMDERIRFVIRLKDGESMTGLCREFGISRKTGYKILERYESCGVEGLNDRSRRPVRYANQLPEPVIAAIVRTKREKPHWRARKIRERLLRQLPQAVKIPAISTILDRHDLVNHRRRNQARAEGTPLSAMHVPQEDQSQHHPGRTGRRNQGGRRRHLARQLYAVRFRLRGSRGEDAATSRQSFRRESVTYVLGTNCYLPLRNVPVSFGLRGFAMLRMYQEPGGPPFLA